jgi:hypothetical protein
MSADLLALLAAAHPNASQGDLLALLADIPDAKAPRRPQDGQTGLAGRYPIRKPQRPPVRAVAIERRRRLASSGPLPPPLACLFTTGELAVLRIVGDECRDKGACLLPLGAIAARAGVCRKLAQNAIRLARREGLLHYEERRTPGQVSKTNVLKIASKEWGAWLARGPRRENLGGKKFAPTDTRVRNPSESRSGTNGSKAAETAGDRERSRLGGIRMRAHDRS